jgi:glycosyltransferase involved in cell wall biosynthesis
MRILLLAQFFPPDIGGEELHVFNLANTLAQRGHEVGVATQRMVGVEDEEILASGVRVHRFGTAAMRVPRLYSTSRAHHPPVPDPLGVRALGRIIQEEQPDVVHAHNWIVNSAVAVRRSSPTGLRSGLVLTLHDFSHVCATKRMMRKGSPCCGPAVARCLACATARYGPVVGPLTGAATALMRPWRTRAIDHVVCVSNAVASGNRLSPGPHVSVIPNFVPDELVVSRSDAVRERRDGRVPDGLAKEKFVLFVGEVSRDKGAPTLLRAYEALGANRPRLLLVGRRTPDTPMRLPEGAEMCAEWPHEDVMTAFRRCLFAVLPSICLDACPSTVLEAMASGRPVVATRTGGIVDVIVDGESGFLVPPDAEDKLAEVMARLLDDTDLRVRLGAAAQDRVQRFTASAVVERLETVYARVALLARRTRTSTPDQARVVGGEGPKP